MGQNYESSSLEVIKSEQDINQRIGELAREIDDQFAGEEVVVVGVLKGSFIFFSDLIRQMKSEVTCEFFGTSEYTEGQQSSGEVKITLDLNSPISGKNVLLVEDIVSDALTLRYLSRILESRSPKMLKTCCFVRKKYEEDSEDDIDYVGFEIAPSDHIVGYGIDYEGRYRNLPNLVKLKI
jgi:hypoxanthine phosphoribosyltransferase